MLLKPNFNLFRWQIVCTSPRILKLEDIKIICIFLPTGRGGGNYPRWVRGRARWHSGIQRSLQPFTARMCQLHATVRVRGGPGDGDRAPPTQDSTSAASPPAVAPGPAARCRRATGRPRRARIRPTPRPLPGRCWGRERLPRRGAAAAGPPLRLGACGVGGGPGHPPGRVRSGQPVAGRRRLCSNWEPRGAAERAAHAPPRVCVLIRLSASLRGKMRLPGSILLPPRSSRYCPLLEHECGFRPVKNVRGIKRPFRNKVTFFPFCTGGKTARSVGFMLIPRC